MTKTEQIIEFLKLNPNATNKDVQSKIGCSERMVRYAKNKSNKNLEHHTKSNQYSFEEQENKAIVSSKGFKSSRKDRVKILNEFLSLCQVDLKTWEVERYLLNAWDVTMSGTKSSTNEDATYTNYQIKVWLKKQCNEFSTEEIKQEFIKAIQSHKPYQYKPQIYKSNSNNAAEISIHDLHYGSLCWGPETGSNYDIKIAEKIFLSAIDNLIAYIIPFNPERIVFPLGSDFFNVNDKLNMTAAGTQQDEDCRWQKTFVYGARMVIKAVDRLKSISPVDILVIPGNHDEERAFYLGEYINSWYKDCLNVFVDNKPLTRKYWQWGKCLVGFTHGKEEAKGTLPILMATEVPVMWSTSEYREWHTGHLHHKNTKSYDYGTENQGIRERIMPSLAAKDSWHNKKGYSGLRSAEAFIWNKDSGNTARFSYQPIEYWVIYE